MDKLDIQDIMRHLENHGVLCEIRHRSFPGHSELDYDYISCDKDWFKFEISLKNGDLPVLQLVTYRGGERFGMNYMFGPAGQMKLSEDLLVDYIISYSVDYFINNVKKQLIK